jgi:Thioredoxin
MATLLAPLIALAVLAAGAVALGVQRRWQRRLVGTSLLGTASAGVTRSLPDILYFTGANCTVCQVAQRPALARLRELIDDVVIREIDVADDPHTARAYRVMTLPTTVVFDSEGRMTAVNAGYAAESVLSDQVIAARRSARQPAVA